MSFETGFDCVKKYKDIPFEEMKACLRFLEYKHNDWAVENYATFGDYCKSQYDEEEVILPSLDAIAFYEKNYFKDGKKKDITLDWWGGEGAAKVDIIMANKLDCHNFDEQEEIEITDLDFNFEPDHKYDLVSVNPVRSIKFNEDEDSETLTPIDGVEVQECEEYEDGWEKHLVYKTEWDETSLFYCKDIHMHNRIKELQNVKKIIDILGTDDYFIWYWRSY